MHKKVLVIGYGNPARGDDALGPALADAIEKLDLPGVSVDSDYQLNVEDAAAAATHDVVVFADAAVSGPEPFSFETVAAADDSGFTTHHVEPPTVLALAHEVFQASPKAFTMGIRGYAFEMFEEGLSAEAEENLQAAVDFLKGIIPHNLFDDAADTFAKAQVPVPAGNPRHSSITT